MCEVCYKKCSALQADFPTVIGVTLDREDGTTPMETDGEKSKQSGTTYYIDTNQLRVPRENMEVMSPLKNGMSRCLCHGSSFLELDTNKILKLKIQECEIFRINFHLIVVKKIFFV